MRAYDSWTFSSGKTGHYNVIIWHHTTRSFDSFKDPTCISARDQEFQYPVARYMKRLDEGYFTRKCSREITKLLVNNFKG